MPSRGPEVEAVNVELEKQTVVSGETLDLNDGVPAAHGGATAQCKVPPCPRNYLPVRRRPASAHRDLDDLVAEA